jgi:hypothetical protein
MRRDDISVDGPEHDLDVAAPPVLLVTRPMRVLLNAFRHVELFRDRYDEAELALATSKLAEELAPDYVPGSISDILLLDHELRWHSLASPDFGAPGARRMSAFEQQLLDLIAAEQHGETHTAIDLALGFGARRPGVLLMVARKLALRLLGGRMFLAKPCS